VLYTNPQPRGRIAHWMMEEIGQPYEMLRPMFTSGENWLGADVRHHRKASCFRNLTCVARINGRPAAMQTNRINQERMESAGAK
jgi:hypothetical protein